MHEEEDSRHRRPAHVNRAFDDALKYIRSKKTIRDVLISGGDPLMLKTAS